MSIDEGKRSFTPFRMTGGAERRSFALFRMTGWTLKGWNYEIVDPETG
jgi:hypothetical protein